MICLLIVIPASFAVDNETVVEINADNQNNTLSDMSDEVLTGNDYYFDASVSDDYGDGSQYNPYKRLTSYRIFDDSVIHLATGEYDFDGSKTVYNVTIIGENPQTTIIKNAKFTVTDSLVLSNVTLISSNIANNKNLTALNCIFKDSSSSMYGGVINSNNGNIIMDNCEFINNTAQCGGAVYNKAGSLIINNSRFFDNHAELFGGAVTAVSTNLTVNNVTARNNKADTGGGVIYLLYGIFEAYNSTFLNNFAESGGALFIDNVEYNIIKNNSFSNNTGYSLYSFYNPNSTIVNNRYDKENDVFESSDASFIGNNNYALYYCPIVNITDIPSRYDLRDYGYVTSVKSQGSNGNCWAFATLATLESCILKALGDNFDLSESNLKNLFMKYGDYGWKMETNTGGYASMGYNYLTSWLGPVLESDDPYILNSLYSKIFNSTMHVQNVLFIQRTSLNETEEIKKIIMTYGSVYSQIYSSFKNGKQYYSGGTNANHAISIVGWDDNLEFEGAPGKGGWIIKNSWGTGSGDKGFYYVSYYDTSCLPIGKTDGAFTFILNDTMKYDKNYQYDIQGKSDFFINSSSTVWYKNIFKATDDEYLAAVSTIFEKNTNYTFSVYVNNVLKFTQSGFSKPGYYTFNLDDVIALNAGDSFEIRFNITVDGDAGVPISEKISFNKHFYKENTSFLSYDGENWVDFYNLTWKYTTHTYDSQVACIKAFTVLNKIGTYLNLTVDNIVDDTCDIIAEVCNEWGYAVNKGKVTFNVSDSLHAVDIINGWAKLSNVNISHGVNEFSAWFTRDNYVGSNNTLFVSNSPINTTLNLSFNSSENPVTIQAIIKDSKGSLVKSGKIIFHVESIDYAVGVVNGIATLSHMFENTGKNNISAYYSDLYCYNSSNGNDSIDIQVIYTNITLKVMGVHNPINITAVVTDIEGNRISEGNVTFNIEGRDYTVDISNGNAKVLHIFENIGLNNIFAQYNGKYNYNASKCNSSVNVSLIKTYLELEVNHKTHNPVEIIAYVYDEDDNPVNTGNVVFNLNNIAYTLPVANGTSKLIHVFQTMGVNNFSVCYVKNQFYDSSQNATGVNISKINVNLSMSISKSYDTAVITITTSAPVEDYIYLNLNGERLLTKVKDCEATFTLTQLPKDDYMVEAYLDSYTYRADSVEGNFTVINCHTEIIAEKTRFHIGNNVYQVSLKDSDGVSLKNKQITVTVGDKTYKNMTDENGVALFNLNLELNDNNLTVYFEGDEDYLNCTVDTNITVNKTILAEDSTKTFNSYYEIVLIDDNGHLLNNANVIIKISSTEYVIKTDENGLAKLLITLNPGTYTVEIYNMVSGEVKNQTITVVKRITENSDLNMYYAAGKYYNVKVLDDNGNAANTVTVKFTISNKKYTKTTDSKGYASFKISKNPGKYVITAEYKGYKVSNKITIKSTIITKNIKIKKGKTIKFTAKLLNKNGKILKNKKLKFKFKGKVYKVKTNRKGKATLKITKKYKVGKYTIITSYGKLKVKNLIRIKK